MKISATFYGVILDRDDPFLSHNLDRLEKRFRERYFSSVEKNRNREKGGKTPHLTVVKSMEDNKNRFIMTRLLRCIILEEKLTIEI